MADAPQREELTAKIFCLMPEEKKSLMPSLPTFFPALGFVDKNYFTFRGKMFDCYDYFCNFANLIPTGWTWSIRNLLKFC